MTCTNCPGTSSEDIQNFEKNSMLLSQKLLASETWRSAEFYKNQLFPVLTAEEIQEKDEMKARLFKESFQHMRKSHRPDLLD